MKYKTEVVNIGIYTYTITEDPELYRGELSIWKPLGHINDMTGEHLSKIFYYMSWPEFEVELVLNEKKIFITRESAEEYVKDVYKSMSLESMSNEVENLLYKRPFLYINTSNVAEPISIPSMSKEEAVLVKEFLKSNNIKYNQNGEKN